jgi:uncharacterized protein
MKSSFIGRDHHLAELESRYHDSKADLVLIYGRRRVGKSRLIHEFVRNKKHVFFFTGVEGTAGDNSKNARQVQIENFLSSLAELTRKKDLKQTCHSWDEALLRLHMNLPKKDLPCCLVFDEFPWMAGGRLELVRALFKFWETKWSLRKKLMLIVCGSSVGFLDKHFVRSTQFYGRSSLLINLSPLTIFEAKKFFEAGRSPEEVLEFYMIFGGIPRYLEQISKRDSIRKTINRLCFSDGSFFIDEIPHLLGSSFMRESDKYQKILKALVTHESLNYESLSSKIRSAKGSSLKHLLQNLIHSDMIEKFTPLDKFGKTNLFRFRLKDEFIRFYYLFIYPSRNLIRDNTRSKDIYDILIPQRRYYSWKGRAFEGIVQKHAMEIAEKIGLGVVVKSFGSYFLRGEGGPQIDLIFLRTDKTMSVCEIKYSENVIQLTRALQTQIRTQKEFLQRRFPGKRIEHYLITNQKTTASVIQSDYFHRIINFLDL